MTAPYLAPDLIEKVRELRYEDGLTREQIQQATGVHPTTCTYYAPGRFVGKVPNDLVRQAFLDSGRTAASVATEIGWTSPNHKRGGKVREGGDSSRLLRTLGLRPGKSGTGVSTRRYIDAETAMTIAEACGVAGWSVLPDEGEQAA